MVEGQLQEGTLLNERYRILRVIGQGGMGTVYLGEHVRLETILAIKEILNRPGTEADEDAVIRFEQEARFLVRLNHPNLPKISDAFVDSDRLYLAMEFIEGVTLETKMREAGYHPLDVLQTVDWALQIADVLAYLHSQDPPIIFRDLKPSNIMIQPDSNVRLIDFGIARRFQPGAVKDTALLGSVGYSPPEQFGRHQTDTRSDIYALGATLHHVLTARDPAAQPFKFPFATTLNPLVPESLSRLLQSCLAMDADHRPATIHEVARVLLGVRDEIRAQNEKTRISRMPAQTSLLPDSSNHPRIISAKLAEAENLKRRTEARKHRHGDPAAQLAGFDHGGTSHTAGPRYGRFIAIGSTLVAIITLLIYSVVTSHRHPHQTSPGQQVVLRPQHDADEQTGVSTNAGMLSSQSQLQPFPNADGSITDPAVSLELPVVKGVTFGANGAASVGIGVRGVIKGGIGRELIAVIFFTDANGNSIAARNMGSAFASRDGQLSTARKLQVSADPESFDWVLEVPVSDFPETTSTEGVKYHCVAFVNGVNVAETPPAVLPADIFGSVSDPTSPVTGDSSDHSSQIKATPPTSSPKNYGQLPRDFTMRN